jgi:hypothetical protein
LYRFDVFDHNGAGMNRTLYKSLESQRRALFEMIRIGTSLRITALTDFS